LRQAQESAAQAARTAEQRLKSEKRQRAELETRLAHRRKVGQKAAHEKRVPKIILNTRKFQAENAASKVRHTADDRIQDAQRDLGAASEQLRRDASSRIDLPDPGLSNRRRVAELASPGLTVEVRGGERVALTGDNGVGKTSLLAELLP